MLPLPTRAMGWEHSGASLSGNEPVAFAAHRGEVARLFRVGLEELAQPYDEVVHRALGGRRVELVRAFGSLATG